MQNFPGSQFSPNTIDFELSGCVASFTVTTPPPADTTPPVISTSVSGTLGNNGWHTSDVTVSWTVSDGQSAVVSSSGCGPTTINADTAGTTLTCTATSAGGTASESVTVKRDATAPAANASVSPAPNANGWNNTDVTVAFSGTDDTSGIASCSPAAVVIAEGAGQSVLGTCMDNAGNSAAATVSVINVKTAPVLNPSASPNPVLAGGSVAVNANAADSLSGLASTVCGPVDTSTAGTKTVTCTATDNAGNSASQSASYTVWGVVGPFAPLVKNGNGAGQFKAGSTIPVKFQITDGAKLTQLPQFDLPTDFWGNSPNVACRLRG